MLKRRTGLTSLSKLSDRKLEMLLRRFDERGKRGEFNMKVHFRLLRERNRRYEAKVNRLIKELP